MSDIPLKVTVTEGLAGIGFTAQPADFPWIKVEGGTRDERLAVGHVAETATQGPSEQDPGVPDGRKRIITDALLQEVAQVYRANLGNGPTRAVAQHFGKAHRTAALWVQRARKAGHLGPAAPGKERA